MTLTVEKYYPYALGGLGALAWCYFEIYLPKNSDVLISTLTVSGILVGFLSTSQAILLSIQPAIMKDLAKSGYILDLVSYISQSIWASLLLCAFNILGFFVDYQSLLYGVVWSFLATVSLGCFIRVTKIMLSLFKYAHT